MSVFQTERLRSFAAAQIATPTIPDALRVRPLARSLESAVALVSAAGGDGRPLQGLRPFVAKQLRGPLQREIGVYRWLDAQGLDLQPRLLGSEAVAADESYLYLEFIRRAGAWPWRDPQQAIRVVQALARLHGAQSAPPQELSPQREDELHQSALATLHTVEGVAARCDWLRPHLRHLRRIVDALPDVRCELLERESVLIHGDVHSGNVQLVRRAGHDRVVLVDWARARIGHGLEDVSSWLLSLGFWVPGARQRHDTLLAAYVAARGGAPGLTPALRRLYWLAGACNALGGALRYHAWIADPLTASSPRRRADAARAAADWLRVIRRAEAYWQGHGRPRGWSTNCD